MSLYSPASKFKVSPSFKPLIFSWIASLEEPGVTFAVVGVLTSSACIVPAASSVNCNDASSADTELALKITTKTNKTAKIKLFLFIFFSSF